MSRRPVVVSLCSGIGGLDLGLEWAGFEVAAQVELDPYCRAILARHWPEVPRHDDIATFPAWWHAQPRPKIDLIAAGFPCQPVSDAGKRQAQADPRWLWPQVARCVRLLRPRLVLLENVPGLLRRDRGMAAVLGTLASLGYDAQWDCLAAVDVGAPHLRRRVFTLAHPSGACLADPDSLSIKKPHRRAASGQAPPRRDHPAGRGPAVADPEGLGRLRQGRHQPGPRAAVGPARPDRPGAGQRDAAEPGVGGGAHGPAGGLDAPTGGLEALSAFPAWPAPPGQPQHSWEPPRTIAGRQAHRTRRLAALGNAVVPKVAQVAGRWAMTVLDQLDHAAPNPPAWPDPQGAQP